MMTVYIHSITFSLRLININFRFLNTAYHIFVTNLKTTLNLFYTGVT